MEVKEAARTAKEYLVDLFEDEGVMDVGLEEVVFDEISNSWLMTIGFSRPWDRNPSLAATLGDRRPPRSYKVVRVHDDDGCVESVTYRVLPASR